MALSAVHACAPATVRGIPPSTIFHHSAVSRSPKRSARASWMSDRTAALRTNPNSDTRQRACASNREAGPQPQGACIEQPRTLQKSESELHLLLTAAAGLPRKRVIGEENGVRCGLLTLTLRKRQARGSSWAATPRRSSCCTPTAKMSSSAACASRPSARSTARTTLPTQPASFKTQTLTSVFPPPHPSNRCTRSTGTRRRWHGSTPTASGWRPPTWRATCACGRRTRWAASRFSKSSITRCPAPWTTCSGRQTVSASCCAAKGEVRPA